MLYHLISALISPSLYREKDLEGLEVRFRYGKIIPSGLPREKECNNKRNNNIRNVQRKKSAVSNKIELASAQLARKQK